jgi:hypothetical protein
MPKVHENANNSANLTGRQIRHNKRLAKAKLARKILVGVFICLYPRIATMISKLPINPRRRVSR